MSEQPQFGSRPPAAPFHHRAEFERAKRGWTLVELAERSGVSRVTYHRLLTIPTPPFARTVQRLCEALGIPLTEGLRLAGLDLSLPLDPVPPQWARDLHRATEQLQEGLAQAGSVLSAQAAMGWAYRGDLDATRKALIPMGPEQLRELSAAASLLAALADEELSTR